MPNTRRLLQTFLLFLVIATSLGAPVAAEVDWNINLRLRWETTDTPSPDSARDPSFDFTHLRARVGLDAKGSGRWSFHGVLQGAATDGLPENGGFGIGRVYFAANGESDPSAASIVELSVSYTTERMRLTIGRQPWADGTETMTGVAYLDGVKKSRLGHRLLGTWDWVNVGRRYDGASLGWTGESFHIAAFGFVPLAGGVNYDDAHEQLDDLEVLGATLTARYGQTLGAGEWRLFVIEYDDERPAAFSAAGGAIDIQTLGGSLLLGGDRSDVLLWVATQSGDWGPSDHEALAWIAELGRQFEPGGTKLALRLGLAEASGDDDAGDGDHETFFNLLPTNHKWYGAIDYSAFQNLRDLYFDLRWNRGAFGLSLGLHRFELVEQADAWYGGSGAFNETVLGFAPRRVSSGRFADDALASEIDLGFHWTHKKSGLKLDWGISFFDGDDAAAEVLRVDEDGTWAFIQASWKR